MVGTATILTATIAKIAEAKTFFSYGKMAKLLALSVTIVE